MSRTIKEALRIAQRPLKFKVMRKYAEGGAISEDSEFNESNLTPDHMADGGVPDEESQERFLKEQLEGSAPQYEPEAGFKTAKEAALLGAGFVPGSGLATAAGKFPTAEGGFEPSVKEDIKSGRYGSAALKAAGAAGDVVSAIPVAGTAAGALLKAPLAAKLAMAAAPMAKVAREAAPAVKEAAQVAEEAKPAYQRLVNPAGFYSRAHEVAMTELPEGPRTWQEMHSLMSKAPGMKKEELQWSGLHPEAFDPQHKITREEIAAQVEKNFPQVERVVKSKNIPEKLTAAVTEANVVADAAGKDFADTYRVFAKQQPENVILPTPWDIRDAVRLGKTLPGNISEDVIAAAKKAEDTETARSEAREALTKASNLRPMHESYTVPGGTDYSERVLTHQYNPKQAVESLKNDPEYRRLSDEANDFYAQKDRLEQQPESAERNAQITALEDKLDIHEGKLDALREAAAQKIPSYTQQRFRHEAHLGDINNPIVHTRNSVRTGPNGEKIWHQEEIQSDWAQQGREKGFRTPETAKARESALSELQSHVDAEDAYVKKLETQAKEEVDATQSELLSRWEHAEGAEKEELAQDVNDFMAERGRNIRYKLNALKKEHEPQLTEIRNNLTEARRRLDAIPSPSSAVPRAPHVEDTEHWLNLAAKDTLSNAIENGFDKIFITGGQEQAKRWSNELRKAVDNVRWESPASGEDQVSAWVKAAEQQNFLRNQIANTMFDVPWDTLSATQQRVVDRIALQTGKVPEIPQFAPEGSKVVYAKPVGSEQEHRFVVQPVEKNGKTRVEVVDSSIPSAKGETLSAVIGGDLAKRVMSEESGSQPMKGYRMGSEGYEQTYNRKAPSVYKKLMKQLDPEAKVEAGPLALTSAQKREEINDFIEDFTYTNAPDVLRSYGVRRESELHPAQREMFADRVRQNALEAANKHFGQDVVEYALNPESGGVQGTYLRITPKMREEYFRLKKKNGSVFPAYKRGGAVDKPEIPRYTKSARQLLDKALTISRKLTE